MCLTPRAGQARRDTFRVINISFVSEVALLRDRLGVNVWEV